MQVKSRMVADLKLVHPTGGFLSDQCSLDCHRGSRRGIPASPQGCAVSAHRGTISSPIFIGGSQRIISRWLQEPTHRSSQDRAAMPAGRRRRLLRRVAWCNARCTVCRGSQSKMTALRDVKVLRPARCSGTRATRLLLSEMVHKLSHWQAAGQAVALGSMYPQRLFRLSFLRQTLQSAAAQ
jgi:hypothetical protein